MSEKSINYMARDFNTIKSELINLSKQYYPELTDSLQDASVGSWIIDLVSAVGDDLNYYIDRCYNEQNVNSAALKSSVLNLARMNNLKIPGPKAAMTEIEVTVTLPSNNGDSMSAPNWNVAPKIEQGAMVTNGTVEFEITEDVNFAEQFNKDSISNRRWSPTRNAQGAVTGYTVTKSVMAIAGRTRLYQKVLVESELKPYMEVLLPFKNVMEVEGVLFKETTDLTVQPQLFEFAVNAEKFRVAGQSLNTYRFFEVNSLVDQYRFGEEVVTPGEVEVYKDPHAYVTYVDNGNMIRYYKGSWMPLMQKFITEYTDTGYLKLIFGSGNNSQSASDALPYAERQMTKMVNNDLTGILPKAGWSMYILYRDGGGAITNVAPGAVNRFNGARWVFPSDVSFELRNAIKESVRVRNVSVGVSGIDAPSVNDIKYLVRYNTSAQDRCVTLKDYELRVKMMPSKYGAPYRCKAIEENNKVVLYMMGLTSDGDLTTALPDVMVENTVNYLSQFKNLGDYIELRSANIYNIQVEVSVLIEKTYNKKTVVTSIINTVDEYFTILNRDLGENIFIGELEKQISALDGVANLISVDIYSVWGMNYGVQAPVPIVDDVNQERFRAKLNLDAVNKVLTSEAQGMYEIKNKATDIKVKIATI